MSVPTGPAVARPVTPVGIAADLLASLVGRAGDLPDDVRRDLARAHGLVAGLDDYVARCTTPASGDLVALEARTRSEAWDAGGTGLEQEMLSGHVEGAFLRMLVAATRARQVLEIGMFTGYSALAMAEALPPGGRLVACEVDEHAAAVARAALAPTSAGALVDVRVGEAASTLRDLAGAGERFDLVFVDADKAGYAGYLDALLDLGLLAEGGLVVVDNTLMQGQPWLPEERTGNGAAIAEFNARLVADERVEQVLVPLRDGVTLVRRVA
ncbi:SAM-dependent methyltransferase [Nocardioides dongxiaopingii]|uniref:O-methyltransferase n=1 Tax=Nocardioides TaxID=1839 RepID=UPI0010C769B2|nr:MULTISPECIES: class I SAM-dependent methyltransferase [Nocardioides]QDH10933.1 SAM-dependent methyltransferase [Nocardioides sp. S-1144]